MKHTIIIVLILLIVSLLHSRESIYTIIGYEEFMIDNNVVVFSEDKNGHIIIILVPKNGNKAVCSTDSLFVKSLMMLRYSDTIKNIVLNLKPVPKTSKFSSFYNEAKGGNIRVVKYWTFKHHDKQFKYYNNHKN